MSTNDAKTTDANYRDLAECERAYGPIPERIRLVMASLPEADLAASCTTSTASIRVASRKGGADHEHASIRTRRSAAVRVL